MLVVNCGDSHLAITWKYAHNTDAIREQTNKILSTIFIWFTPAFCPFVYTFVDTRVDKMWTKGKIDTKKELPHFWESSCKRWNCLLLSVLHSNGHGDGSANHGVVALGSLCLQQRANRNLEPLEFTTFKQLPRRCHLNWFHNVFCRNMDIIGMLSTLFRFVRFWQL